MQLKDTEHAYNPKGQLEELTKQSHENLMSGKTREYVFGKFAFDLHVLWREVRQQGRSESFLNGILEASKIIEPDLPEPLKKSGETVLGKQQPSLTEAIRETTKRLLFFERLIKNIPPSVTGAILGGSMSYGAFYNVRGVPSSSDLDIFLIVDQEFFRGDHGLELISLRRGFLQSTCDDFALRSGVFQRLWEEGKADLMSIKSPIDDYLISIKVFPRDTFNKEFDTELNNMIQTDEDAVAVARDYKQESYLGPYLNSMFIQSNFYNQPYKFRLTEEYPLERGAIVSLPAAIIANGHLYTGQHHNHIIPSFNVEYDADGSITAAIDHFKNHLKHRFEIEKNRASDPSQLEFINCSDRRPLLSAQMIELAEQIYPTSNSEYIGK